MAYFIAEPSEPTMTIIEFSQLSEFDQLRITHDLALEVIRKHPEEILNILLHSEQSTSLDHYAYLKAFDRMNDLARRL